MRLRTLLPLLLALLLPAALAAQVGVTTDLITGRVTGPDGQPVAGARVEVVSAESGIRRTATTGGDGRYTLAFPDGGGSYRVRATAPGLTSPQVGLARQADEDVLVANLRLGQQVVTLEGIQVQAERPQPGRGETGAQERFLSGEVVSRLPLENNDAATLATLSPGVVGVAQGDSSEARGAFSVAGQRASLNNVTLDGASFSSALTGGQAGGGSPLGFPQEGLRGTQVVTNTFDVSRGQFAGGLVSMTTRGGTNNLSGSFQYVLRDPSLQGTGGEAYTGGGYTQNRVSGGIGGPIVRDKLFYYASFQLQRRTDELFALRASDDAATLDALGVSADSVSRFLSILQDQYGIPTVGQTGAFGRTGDAFSVLGRVDWTASETHTLALRGHLSLFDQDDARIGFLDLRQNGGESQTRGWGGIATLTSRFGSGWVNELRLSLTQDRRDQDPYAQVPEGRVRVSSTLPDGTTGISTLVFGGDRSLPTASRERTLEATNELSLLWRESHRIKVGALVNHGAFEQRGTSNVFGTFSFNSLEDFAAGRAASFTRSLAPRETSGGGLNAALWLGDTWRPTQKLQLTFGARLEGSRFGETPEANPEVERLFGRRTDRAPSEVRVSPRAGFSLRLNDQGEPLRLFRGGIGEFRGRAPFGLYAGALDQTGLDQGETQLVCVGEAVPMPDWAAFGSDPAAIPSACADGGMGTPSAGRRPNVTLFSDDFGAPRSWRGSLGFQAQLRPRLNVNVDLNHARGVGLYGVRDLNLVATPAFTLSDEGRPVYAPAEAIVPSTGEVGLFASRRAPEFAQVLALDSELESTTTQLTMGVSGQLPLRIFAQANYTFSRSRDQSSFSCCSAAQGFSSATTAGDPNRREWATSDLERRHSLNVVLGVPIRQSFEVTLVGRASSGAPFTPLVGGDVNGDGARNDRAFVFSPDAAADPAVAEGMRSLLAAAPERVRECLREQTGEIAERNSCRGPWSATLDLRTTFRPTLPRLGRRLTVSLDAVNLGAGLDLLLHDSDGLRGWGQGGFADPVLVYPDSFSVADRRFVYRVNERFGQSRARRGGSPFQVQLSGRILVGAQQQGGGGGLGAIGFGGGGGGGGGGGRGGFGGFGGPGGGGGGGGGFDAEAAISRLLPEPVSAILLLRDTLGLSEEQAGRLRAISDSLKAKNAPVAEEIRRVFAEQQQQQGGGNRGEGGPGQVFQRIGPQLNQGRQNVADALEQARAVLTPEQWRRVPSALRNPFDGFGPRGRRQER